MVEVEARVRDGAPDDWGRRFGGKPPLTAPHHAVKVTGALFHTQGGLAVDGVGRVLREDGSVLPNPYAGGGAARGISGPLSWGYMAGNGLPDGDHVRSPGRRRRSAASDRPLTTRPGGPG